MLFKHNDETFTATPGAGLLAALGQANDHFSGKLPTPGMWYDGADEPNECGGKTRSFFWAEGNFFD